MAKTIKKKTVYVCQDCGYDSPKWMGRCPGCGAWNTMVEEIESAGEKKKASAGGLSLGLSEAQPPQPIGEVVTEKQMRFATGSGELDRVLGGGVIPGSVVLIAGDPGVGKSSLTIKICANIASGQRRVLYVTGEESAAQVRLRADRLMALSENLYVVSETNLETIISYIQKLKPEMVVIDSIQTIFRPDLESAPGSVSQVRECSVELLRVAKSSSIAVFIIGHVTKEGNLAGPRVLEHIVDTVLFFEGEKNIEYRILRAVKNRFGSTNEIGIFEMRDTGLIDVPDASKRFLSEVSGDVGTVVMPVIEGTRPVLLELQSLVAQTPYIPPRRTSDTIDLKRIQLLLAVLEKRGHIPIGACDVYVKTAGGMRIDEPAADLAICVSMASSFYNKSVKARTIIFGEVGLSGDVKAVSHAEGRIREACRLGFKWAVIPKKNADRLQAGIEGIEVKSVSTIKEALAASLV